MLLIKLTGAVVVGGPIDVELVVEGLVLAGVAGVGVAVLGGPVAGVMSVVDGLAMVEGASVGAVLASVDSLSEPHADTATANAKDKSAVDLGAHFETTQGGSRWGLQPNVRFPGPTLGFARDACPDGVSALSWVGLFGERGGKVTGVSGELDDVLELEHDGWRSLCDGTGSGFYGEIMTADARTVLANGAIMTRDEVIASLNGAPPWEAYEIADPAVGMSLTPTTTRAGATKWAVHRQRADASAGSFHNGAGSA